MRDVLGGVLRAAGAIAAGIVAFALTGLFVDAVQPGSTPLEARIGHVIDILGDVTGITDSVPADGELTDEQREAIADVLDAERSVWLDVVWWTSGLFVGGLAVFLVTRRHYLNRGMPPDDAG